MGGRFLATVSQLSIPIGGGEPSYQVGFDFAVLSAVGET